MADSVSTVSAATGMPRINDKAPDFTANTTHGPITFSEWAKGSWVVLFSHPADFTPVCTTELTEFARRAPEFAQRGAKLMGLSIDSIHSHLAWRENIREKLKTEIGYPLVADLSTDVARKYGMIHPGASETSTVRAVFLIDPQQKIRALVYYPMNVGRNIEEVVRVLDALQTADKHGVATPVNWCPGQKVIVPPPKTEAEVEARKKATDTEKVDFYLSKRDLKA